jgi:hypothetical protein
MGEVMNSATTSLREIARLIVDGAMPATNSGATCFVPRYQIDRLEAALSTPPAGEWMPIASAPKDGTSILAYSPDRCGNCPEGATGVGGARWLNGKWCVGRLQDGRYVNTAHAPTHWQPLPPPPKPATQEVG